MHEQVASPDHRDATNVEVLRDVRADRIIKVREDEPRIPTDSPPEGTP